ncbi:hypothetical protein KY337_05220 [Candidatus Woesearchaeota archaeon]|nr:hypothetical protein [Candidatus Woesearchaeota archaeon]
MRKSQITIFITVAVIIILLGFAILFIYKFPKAQTERSSSDVEMFVQQCVKDVSNDALQLMFLQGGYIYPENYLETEYQKISYDLPDKATMEQELSTFIEAGLPKCINISFFSDYGYDVSYEKPTVTTQINGRAIHSSIHFPLTIKKGTTTKSVDNFNSRSSIRFAEIYMIVQELRQEEWLDLTKASTYGAEINIIAYNNNTIITVTDEKSYINSDYFRFVTVI